MSNKPIPDHDLHQALALQKQNAKAVDRILWIVLPILSFLLSAVIANIYIWSFLGTFIVLSIALIAVGIKRFSLAVTLIAVVLYCLVDNYLSYHLQFSVQGLKRQLLCMVLFIAIVGLMRPLTDRALINKAKMDS